MHSRVVVQAVYAIGALMWLTGCGRADTARPADTTRPVANLTWSRQIDISQNRGGGAAPTFAVAPDGRVLLGWVTATKGGSDGRLFLRPFATTDTTVIVSELRDASGNMTINGEVPVKIAFAPNGTLYAAYLVTKAPLNGTPRNSLRFATSPDAGRTWATPVTVVQDTMIGTADDHAMLVTADGTVYLSWLTDVAIDTSRAFMASSHDGGATWSAPRALDDAMACPCCRTAMAAGPDGSLYVAWRKRFPQNVRDIVVARSGDGGMTWGKPVRVFADEWQVNFCPVAGPSIRVGAKGTVHVAWWTGRPGRAGTQYSHSTDKGQTFSTPYALGLAPNSRASHIQLALGAGADEGTIVAAWDDGTMSHPQIVTRISRDGGRSFSAPETISSAADQASFPAILLQHDSLLVAWQEHNAAGSAADLIDEHTKEKSTPEKSGGADRNVAPAKQKTGGEVLGNRQIIARIGVLGPPVR